jgi:uncharacterized membrane protein
MKTLMLSLATVLTLTISSTASAWVVHAGPVTVAGRHAAVRRPVPVVRPVARPVAVPVARPVALPFVVQQRRELAVETIQDRREMAREVIQDRREFARETIQELRQAALDAALSAQQP